MAFSRELYRPAASFPVYFSLFYLLNLNFIYSKCPKFFQCGRIGRMEFPLCNYTQPECGLFRVQCDAIPYPLLYLDYEANSSSREILSRITSHVVRIRNPVLEGGFKSKNCAVFNNYSIYSPPPFISLSVFPNITLFKCAKTSTPYFPDYYRKYTGCPHFDIHYAMKIKNISSPDECSVFHLPGELKYESDSTDLFDQLVPEYNVQWFLSVDSAECHNKGGQCTTTPKNEFLCVKAGRSNLKLIFVAGASATALVLFSVILFTFKMRKYMLNLKGKKQNHKDIELFLKDNKNLAPRRYNYSDLKKMTNSFRDKSGEGGFASVYRGKLPDGHLAAVKILKEMKGNGELPMLKLLLSWDFALRVPKELSFVSLCPMDLLRSS